MPSEFQSNEPPHVLGIPVDVTPPSPSEFRDAARGMGMDIFWNHPLHGKRILLYTNFHLVQANFRFLQANFC